MIEVTTAPPFVSASLAVEAEPFLEAMAWLALKCFRTQRQEHRPEEEAVAAPLVLFDHAALSHSCCHTSFEEASSRSERLHEVSTDTPCASNSSKTMRDTSNGTADKRSIVAHAGRSPRDGQRLKMSGSHTTQFPRAASSCVYTKTGFTRTLVVGSDEIERCRRCKQVAGRRGFKGNDVLGCTGALLGGLFAHRRALCSRPGSLVCPKGQALHW